MRNPIFVLSSSSSSSRNNYSFTAKPRWSCGFKIAVLTTQIYEQCFKTIFYYSKIRRYFFYYRFSDCFAKRCPKMHVFVLDLMFLNIVISLHSTKKEVRGTAREDQDLVFSQFFKTRNCHTEVKLVCYTAVFSVVTHATLLPT